MIKFQHLDTAMRQQVEQPDTASKSTKLQSIPFVIDAEGPARVGDYFDHKTKEEIVKSQTSTETVLTNSFHGRALKGKTVKLPSDITGIVYERSVQKDVIYKPMTVVKELTYWKHDEVPNDGDKVNHMLSFTQVLCDFHQD